MFILWNNIQDLTNFSPFEIKGYQLSSLVVRSKHVVLKTSFTNHLEPRLNHNMYKNIDNKYNNFNDFNTYCKNVEIDFILRSSVYFSGSQPPPQEKSACWLTLGDNICGTLMVECIHQTRCVHWKCAHFSMDTSGLMDASKEACLNVPFIKYKLSNSGLAVICLKVCALFHGQIWFDGCTLPWGSHNIEISEIMEKFVKSPILSPWNKLILMVTSYR